jgi:protocatechuate 3,4-dioxygenase beta subunit
MSNRADRGLVPEDLAERLNSTAATCRWLPEQTQGPYHREVHPERTGITEGWPGLPLRLGLRLLASDGATPLPDVLVEVWQANHEGRYSGFQPMPPRPDWVVTSETVPREIVAPDETFLRGAQRTDPAGMCAFQTIYPGWYASRTVHIHMIAHFGQRAVTSQLYFPDEITEEVFQHSPYRGRPARDTTNATDSIFADGGEQTILHLEGDPVAGYAGVLCAAVDLDGSPTHSPTTARP